MKKIIFITTLSFVFLLGCKSDNKSVGKELLDDRNDTVITFIFKERTFKSDTLRHESGIYTFNSDNITYTKESDFISHLVPKNNYKKNDTIRIYTKDNIILSHGYCVNQYSLFKFKPGDIVLFDYPNDYPICKILNNDTENIGLNEFTKLNLKSKSLKSDFVFFAENKRFRTKDENRKEQIEIQKNILNKEKTIVSLGKTNSIAKDTYDLLMQDFSYIKTGISSKSDNLLVSAINLSLPSGRELVSNKFDSIYKPIQINGRSHRYIDRRLQFDNLLKEKKISANNRDYLLYKYMVEIISNFSSDDINKYFTYFSNEVSDKKLIKKIETNYLFDVNETSASAKNIPVINGSKEKFDLNDLIKTKYKNKVIVIDFWASWCMPCRKAMPFSQKLRTEYKQKEVVFLYVSIDKDFEKWKIASEGEGLFLDENNFLALNYPNLLFYKELQINSIPRYLIYNKKGKLVHKNAPSPDSNEIRSELNKYLSQ
nr:TlpA family protein disulfide reductase [uncultured Flavobacterium sp.]